MSLTKRCTGEIGLTTSEAITHITKNKRYATVIIRVDIDTFLDICDIWQTRIWADKVQFNTVTKTNDTLIYFTTPKQEHK